MRPITVRDEHSGGHGLLWFLVGALLGAAGGAVLSERMTLFPSRRPGDDAPEVPDDEVERLFGPSLEDEADEEEEEDDLDEAEDETQEFVPSLDRHVLEAYANDPILAERPIEIEETAEGVIALSGRVRSAREIAHAVTIARGIPGVREVRQRLTPRIRR